MLNLWWKQKHHRICLIAVFNKWGNFAQHRYKGYPEIKYRKRVGGEGKSPLWRWQHCHVLAYRHSLRCGHCAHTQQCIVLCEFKINMSIPNHAKCQVCTVIQFLNVKGEAPNEIHCQIVSIYGEVRKGRMWQSGVVNLMQEAQMFMMNKGMISRIW